MGTQLTLAMRALLLLLATCSALPLHEFCHHRIDSADNKCYEGCSSQPFHGGHSLPKWGGCSSAWSITDSSGTIEECNDGVTNLKYCTGGKLQPVNVTMKIKSMNPEFNGLLRGLPMGSIFTREYHHEDKTDNQCFEADFPTSCYFSKCAPMAGVTDKGGCPDKYNVQKDRRQEVVCRDGSNIKYCTDKIQVTVTTYGVAQNNNSTMEAPPPEPTHCKTDSDCPCSYCMNDKTKTAPYSCHPATPGVCCTTDKDCPGSYCVNYPGKTPPFHCHGN